MYEGRYKYANGAYVLDSDSVTPGTWFGRTGFPTIIRHILQDVSQLEWAEADDDCESVVHIIPVN
jgi:hypothetical protein